MPDTEDLRKACPDEVCSTPSEVDNTLTYVVDDEDGSRSRVVPLTTDGADETSVDDDGDSDPSRVS